MKKKGMLLKGIVVCLSIAVISCAFVGCGNKEKASGDSSKGDKIVIKIGHTDSSKRSTNKAGEWLGKYLSDKTNGRITVEMYPDGQAGDDPQVVEGVKNGTVTMYFGLASVLASAVGDKASCVDLPYLYDDYDAWVKGTFENGGLELFNDALKDSDYECLDMMYNGMRNVISNDKVYHTPKDFKGQKVRIAQNDLNVQIWKHMGANPTPMAWGEVITSLSQGTIDALDHSIGVFNDFKIYEMAPYVTITNHCSSPYPLVCSKKWLKSLSDDDRQLIEEGVHKMCEKQRKEERTNEKEYLKKFEKSGATVYKLTPDEKEIFKKETKPVYEFWAKKVGQNTIDEWLKTAPKD